MAASVERRAAAKINLALHVVGRRADSYHDLDTLAVFGDVGDAIGFSAADELSLFVSGPFAGLAPEADGNLALKAAAALKNRTGFRGGAAIRLVKNVPVGAGFGGGSADAAATLDALNALWSLGLAPAELRAIGETLGADIPMCLAGHALRARGTGERIEAIEGWPELPLVLVWPGRPVSTADVFAALARRENPPLPAPPAAETPAAVAAWLAGCRNDLEAPALVIAPEIGAVLDALRETPGCLIARMSGSGSGCFGLYADWAEAGAAAAALEGANRGWWVAATTAH